jgi:trigger factor
MNITKEFTPDRQAIVTVEVDEEQMQNALKRAAQNVSRVRPIPGFRPGKAPYEMVERAFGKELLVEEAVEDLSRSMYGQVLRDTEINPVDAGRLEIVQKEPPVFKYTIPVAPVVKLGDYKSIHMQPEPVEVTDAEVEEILSRFQNTQATLSPVARAVQKGDVITVDVRGGVTDMEPVEETNLRVTVGDDKQVRLPFDAELIGMNAGETKEFDYTYADDYEDESVRGKTAHYTVTVHDIKETQLPELTDEFAQVVSQFKTLEQFKGNIRDILLRQKERDREVKFANDVLQAVTDQAEIAYPPVMLEHELEHRLEHLKEDVKRLGLTWENYLRFSGKTEEQIKEELRPQAEKSLKQMLVLGELMHVENITVSREELNADIERRVQESVQAGAQANVARRAYNQKDARENIEFELRVNKIMNKLVAIAKGEPTSGLILTPDMVQGEGAIPSGLITDPDQVRRELEKGLSSR